MDPVLVLDAGMTLAAARSALGLGSPHVMVVVRRRDPRATGAILWYPLDEGELDRVMGPNLDPGMPLGVSLDLHEHGAAEVRQLSHPDVAGQHWTGLVVDGTRAVGWMIPDTTNDRGPTRGIDFGPGSQPAFPRGPGVGLAPGDVDSHVTTVDSPGSHGRESSTACFACACAAQPNQPTAPADDRFGNLGESPGPTAGAEPTATNDAPAPVPAYPRVDVPESVAPGASFEVVVGLSKTAQPGVQGAVMAIAPQPKQLTVQVKAENFTLQNVRYPLDFDPADVEAHTVSIPVIAPSVTEPWRGRIEIEYGLDGLMIGTAWREVLVTPQAPADAPMSTSGGEVAVELDQTVPIDLTVSISRGEADGTFLWTFTTPHPVTLPDEQVITTLDEDTAETFALRKVREMHQVNRNAAAELRVNGVAREVAGVMPLWFWKVLAPVWKIAKDAGRLPTLLLISQESLVPWELATTDADYIVDRSLVDAAAPQILGAQAIVGRWRPAGPETPSGLRRPSTAPAQAMAIRALAVVVGDFLPGSGLRALAQAKEEGKSLVADYPPSVWVNGTSTDVASLLKGTYTFQGDTIDAQAMHVASHGEADPDAVGQEGVILSDSAVRIDEAIVLGSEFTRTAAPLVFLNCCQLASATGAALVEGGLAAAFLQAGARAFIAPLWNVDDTVAKDFALAFYAETLGKSRPVGDVMRELRGWFTTKFQQHDQTTPLAYAYYGHPGLILTRQETN